MLGLCLIILVCGDVLGTPTYITKGSNSLLIPRKELFSNHGSMTDFKNHFDEEPSDDIASTYSSILDKVSTLPQNVISQMITYIEMKLNNLANQTLAANQKILGKRHAFYPQNKNKSYRKFIAPANKKQIGIGTHRPINTHLIKDKETSAGRGIDKHINDTGGYYTPHNERGHQNNITHTNHGHERGQFNQHLKKEHGIDLDKLSPRELHKLLVFLKSLHMGNTTDINGKFKPNIGDICCPVG